MTEPTLGFDDVGSGVLLRLRPTEQWVSTQEAARLLCLSETGLAAKDVLRAVRNRSRSAKGNENCKRVGRLWYRPDLLRLVKIRRECRCGMKIAARLMVALDEGRI